MSSPESQARALIPGPSFDYLRGAAGDERTYDANLQAFQRVHFLPRALVSVSKVSTSTSLPPFDNLPFPVFIAPMAAQKLAHPDGELAIARAACELGIPYISSSFATTSLQDIAKVGGPRLFQLYLFKDRAASKRLLDEARRCGYQAVVLTVDAPVLGVRPRDEKNTFRLPPHMKMANVNMDTLAVQEEDDTDSRGQFNKTVEADLDEAALRWVVKNAGMPVWVKGVMRGDDALRAVRAGAKGIVVSNHGGRQVEGCMPTLHALGAVRRTVPGTVPVLVDGGVRTGEDVVRALGLGADAVLIGREVLWALAVGGEDAVRKLLQGIKEAMKTCMRLIGATTVDELIKGDFVVRDYTILAKL